MKKAKFIVLVLLLPLFLLGAGSCQTTPVPTPERPVTLPVLPDRPSELTEAERAAAARVVAVGRRIAVNTEVKGVSAGADASKQAVLLWGTLQTWLNVIIPVPLSETADDAIIALTKAGNEARKLRAAFRVKYQAAKAELVKLERENILSKRDAAEVHKELLALRAANAAKDKRLKELASARKTVTFWGINIFGVASVVGIVFCFIRYGKPLGTVALVLLGALYFGGMASYIWAWYNDIIKQSLLIAGIILVLAAVVYAFWGAIVEKVFTKKITQRAQAARKKLHETSPEKLKELDEAFVRERALATDIYVKSVKTKEGIESVSP